MKHTAFRQIGFYYAKSPDYLVFGGLTFLQLTKDLECPQSFYFVRALRRQRRTHIQQVFEGEIKGPILIPS